MKALPQHHSNFSSVPVQPTDKVKLVALLKEDVETDRSSGIGSFWSIHLLY